MQSWQSQLPITLAVSAFIVYRFVRRELRPRIVRTRTLWIRPAVMLVVLGVLIFETLNISQQVDGVLALAVAAGVLVGIVTGVLVVRSTTFSPAGLRGAVRVHGSRVTAAVWIGAVLLRLIARLFVPHSDRAAQFALDSGLIALVAVAFAIVAVAFQRAIARHSPVTIEAALQ
jgi:hypothetical protein